MVATETRDVVTSAGGRDDDSDVEIDLESVEEGDQLNSSDDKTEGKNSTNQKNFTKSSKSPFTASEYGRESENDPRKKNYLPFASSIDV